MLKTTSRCIALSVMASVSGVALLAGCSASASPASTSSGAVTIGFSPYNQSAEALIALGEGAQAYAGSQGSDVLIADPNNDASTQVQQTTAWITNGQVDALWFMAVDGPSMAQVITEAQAEGVVILANGVPSDYGMTGPAAGVSFSTLSYEENGRVTGEQVAECVQERLNGEGTAIVVTGATGSAGDAEMLAGIKESASDGAPGLEIVSEVSGNSDRLTSQNAVASALQAHPDADVVIGMNDEASLGAISALTAAGKDPSQLCVVGGGGGDEALAAVESGQMYAVTAVDFASDLTQNIDLLITMAADPTAMGVQLTTPMKVTKK